MSSFSVKSLLNEMTTKLAARTPNGFDSRPYRGVFCQASFHSIYFYGNNKSTGKETGKLHLCRSGYYCKNNFFKKGHSK